MILNIIWDFKYKFQHNLPFFENKIKNMTEIDQVL